MCLLNTKQAVDYIKNTHGPKFSRGTFEVWRCQGRGPRFVRFGRRVYYRKLDLDAFIKAGEVVETIDSCEL